jgi:hypothetical protein
MLLAASRRRPRLANWLAASAFGWSLALIGGAFIVPVYGGEHAAAWTVTSTSQSPLPSTAETLAHTGSTLVAQNGTWVLIPVAVPAVLVLLGWVALGRGRHGRIAATAAVSLLAAFNLVALFTIGVFVIPATVLLVLALLATPALGGAALSGASAPAHR